MLTMSNEDKPIETQETASYARSETGRKYHLEEVGRFALFGPFSLDLETGELRKAGTRVRLQNKPFQILRALILHKGEVVTREELRRHVWPDDTFVDFESGLNTAANRLRLALNDSAENPLYIETLPRVGYRFIGALHFQPQSANLDTGLEPEPVVDTPVPPPPLRPKLPVPLILSLFGIVLLTGFGVSLLRQRHAAGETPSFQQLTFRKGTISNARFTNSNEVVYSADWDDDSSKLYIMNLLSPEARELPFGQAVLASVSPSSEVSFMRRLLVGGESVNELAAAALYGGAPRVVARGIHAADRSSTGETCAIRSTPRGESLEYPLGKVLYETAGWFGIPRVSPDGSLIAVPEHPLQSDDSGSVLVISRNGKLRHVSDGWGSISGLAWSARGNEIWFSAVKEGTNREIYATDLNSHVRRVSAAPAALDLFDISAQGTLLLGRSTPRISMLVGNSKTLAIKDISWLDWSRVTAVSADGNEILFDESGEGGGPKYSVYLYRRNRGTTERIGDGRALDLSLDGAWILTGHREPSPSISLISADDAKTRTLNAPGFIYQEAYFLGKSPHLLVLLSQASTRLTREPPHWYFQNLKDGSLRPAPGLSVAELPSMARLAISPDGDEVAAQVSGRNFRVVQLTQSHRADIQLKDPGTPVAWANEHVVVLAANEGERLRLDEFDINAGRRQALLEVPNDAHLRAHDRIAFAMSADLNTFVMSTLEHSMDLFAASGWS